MEKFKPYFIIFITLMIGFIMGVLTQRMMIKRHIDNVTEKQIEREFRGRLLRGVELTADQDEQLSPILEEHFEKMKTLRMAFRGNVDSLFQDLESILTEEQMDQVKKNRPGPGKRRKRGKGDRPFPPPRGQRE
ncbi:MAG: hypothetical protein AAFR66_22895 [Bacteroidota bacterium]